MDFSHRPNPAAQGRAAWSSDERRGAEVFRDRCESCHAARLVADDPSSRVPFERWESLVMTPEGPIVWARADYEKTGVEPYVNEKGARVVSLRRLYKKYPYFTNGTATSLASLLDRVRYDERSFFHEGAPEQATLQALSARDKGALLGFLDLL
jgi:cytochrome c peroxidase